MMRVLAVLAALVPALLGAAACANHEEPTELRTAAVTPGAPPTGAGSAAAAAPAAGSAAPGAGSAAPKRDAKKGDRQDSDWVAAEFKTGAARWKDTGVYVDGKPIGFLTWGEIPVTLKPIWVRDKVSANKRAGTDDPGWRWMQQRFYRFTDYLRSLGIDPAKVKEMHVYGPRFTNSLVVSGADLRSPAARGFLFQFGGSIYGKAIPHVPPGFGSGRAADKIASLMIYIDKEPPKLVEDEGFVLDGKVIQNVPYYGDPIRGGVRIYLDDRLAAIIKRQDLDPKTATKDADGEPQWSLAELLAAQGVDTKKVVELWVIRGERRTERLPASELPGLMFRANPQSKGGVLLGEDRLRANTIAMHTHALTEDELPYVTPDDL